MARGHKVSTIRFGRRLLVIPALATALLSTPAPAQTATGPTATVTSGPLQFNPAAVGIASGLAQQLTATFNVTGADGSFAPTAQMQYGLSYSAGPVTCTSGTVTQSLTCSVAVTFQPQYPGGRADAVLLMNGTSVLATALVYGVGQSPMSLIQPGVITNPPLSPANAYYYNSIVGEDGTAYVLSSTSNTVTSVSSAGVVNVLPITGLQAPNSIAIDGAANLYIAQNAYSINLVTYSAANGQGTLNIVPPQTQYAPCPRSGGAEILSIVATGITGDLFTFEDLCQEIFKFGPSGFISATPLNPSLTQPVDMITDSSEDLFIGGNQINELTPAGTQTQVNTAGAGNGIAVDAAGTLYVPRYSIYGGVALLPASGYAGFEAQLDASANPLGVGLGPDGTVYVGNYGVVDKIDRSQGALVFGAQSPGNQSSVQTFQVYNGGNEPLTISGIVLSGNGYAMQTAAMNPCSVGLVLAPGALCNQAVTLTPPSSFTSGYLLGTVTVTTNSLNAAAVNQTVALSGYVDGGIDVSVSPATVAFGYQALGTTSKAQTVTLTNKGMSASATIGTITLSDPAFSIASNNCTTALPPAPAAGSSCQLTVTFTPTAQQAYSATGSFTAQASNSFPSQPVSFNLTGITQITVTINEAVSISDNPVVTPSQLLAINEVIHVTDTPVETPSAILPISEVVHVTDTPVETPSAILPISETVHVSDTISGGVAGVALSFSPTSLSFGSVPLGNLQQLSLQLTNSGTSAFSLSQVSLSGSSEFSLSGGTCAATVAAGTSCTLEVQFTPTATGSASAGIGAAGSLASVAVSGTGFAVLTVKPQNTSRSFGTANPAFTYSVTGFVNGDTSAVLSGAAVLSTTATLNSPAGTYPITASAGTLSAPSYYNFSFAAGRLTVNGGAAQTITFLAMPSSIAMGDGPLTLTAHSTSGLAVSYAVSGPASISGSTLTLTGTGQVTITASQSGNATFAPASNVVQSFTVTP
jgi:hypothetical protein